jgi:hypothetical protein
VASSAPHRDTVTCAPQKPQPLVAPSGSYELLRSLESCAGRLKFSEALLGLHSTFDGAMILFQNVVQVLHRSVSTAVAQRPFLLTVGEQV